MKWDKSAYWPGFTLSESTVLLSVILMMFGFLFARAILSLGMILLLINAVISLNFAKSWVAILSNRFALLCALFFFSYLLSGLWSSDFHMLWKEIQIKLPFLVFPFAMISAPLHNKKLQRWVIGITLFMLWIGIAYSFFYLFKNWQHFHDGYHIYGPANKDYLRFTLALTGGLNLVFYLWIKHKSSINTVQNILLFVWCGFAAFYIHLQASKLGLLAFYTLIGIYILYYIFKNRGFIQSALIIGMSLLIGIFSATNFPTVKKQINRFRQEKEMWLSKDREQFKTANSFIPRIISYQAGLNIITRHPVFGVGAGDVMVEMKKEYKANFSFMKTTLIPHNQFIYTMTAVGIPLSLIFFCTLLYPVIGRNPDIFEFSTFAIMLCGTLIEAMLEVQYGVFVYLFFTLFWVSAKYPITAVKT